MRTAILLSFIAAVVCHTVLLFGFRLGTAVRPLPMSDAPSSLDVSLVAGPDHAPTTEALPIEAPVSEAPPSPEPTPEPTATPAPAPEPISETEPLPVPTPPPEPARQTPTPTPASTPAPTPPANPKPQAQTKTRQAAATSSGATKPGGSTKTGTQSGTSPGTAVGSGLRYRSNPRPDYPAESRRNRQEGVVLLSVEVSAEGRPTDVSLKRTSGFPLLDQAAIQAVKRWTFEPAGVAGLPVASHADVPVRFSLLH